MFKVKIDINRKDYLKANASYLRKFIGFREYIMLALLLIAGIFLGIAEIFWPLYLFAVVVSLIIILLALFMFVANKGYTAEFQKRGATTMNVTFFEDNYEVNQSEKDKDYTETYKYTEIDKILIKRSKVYIYGSGGTFLYINYDNFEKGDFIKFVDFIKPKMNIYQLTMSMKRSKYIRKMNRAKRRNL